MNGPIEGFASRCMDGVAFMATCSGLAVTVVATLVVVAAIGLFALANSRGDRAPIPRLAEPDR